VHRIAFTEATGEFPNGVVRHACDNPPCFNPAHLIDGTRRQNTHDSLRRMRQPRAKLDWDLATRIRLEHRLGWSQRELARRYGVSPRLIGRVVRNISWPKEAAP
jgi:hypothetical protein